MKILLVTILWLIVLVLYWPIALFALLLWPVVWLIFVLFRIVGIVIEAFLALVKSILFLPARILGYKGGA